jgi:SAM-dependent methyltransferase
LELFVDPTPTCPLCRKAAQAAPIRRGNLIVHGCSNCGLRFGENEIATAIRESGSVDTDPHHFSTMLSQSRPLGDALAELIDHRLSYFAERLRACPRHWLEIGPGSGLLSDIVARRGGTWRGCEIDPAMAREMSSRGLDVVHGDFAALDPRILFTPVVAEQGGFDIVFLSQVLEHVRKPDQFLANAFSALRPGGMIYVDVPSGDGLTAIIRRLNRWSRTYDEIVPPYHMISYGAKSLRYALRTAGFDNPSVSSWAYNDPTFGLAHARINPSVKLQALWQASGLISLGGNLVGMAHKPRLDGNGALPSC